MLRVEHPPDSSGIPLKKDGGRRKGLFNMTPCRIKSVETYPCPIFVLRKSGGGGRAF